MNNVSQALVETILNNAQAFNWTVQGLGMLRMYIGNKARLHIWNSELEYPGVSKIHNHSWTSLTSHIICGELKNTRYEETNFTYAPPTHLKRRMTCGIGCKWEGEPIETRLVPRDPEIYSPGAKYTQLAKEIHVTEAIPGTCTVMFRKEDSAGQADIFWPIGTKWGTAEPRPATPFEIMSSAVKALRLLNATH